MTRRRRANFALALPLGALLAVGTSFVVAAPAAAATFTVTTTADAGGGSLREAITSANLADGPDIIKFDEGLAGATIDVDSALPAILEGITVDGTGLDDTTPLEITIEHTTAADYPLFTISMAALEIDTDVTFTDLALLGDDVSTGLAITAEDPFNVLGDVVLRRVQVTDFIGTAGSTGGGVHIALAESVLIDASEFVSNSASPGWFGGGLGVESSGAVTITGSLFENNDAASGGAINVTDVLGLTISLTTVTANTAQTEGGGVRVNGSISNGALIEDSFIDSNVATGSGGGIYLGTTADVTITGSLISANEAAAGGGIGVGGFFGELLIEDSIVAGNVASDQGGGLSVETIEAGAIVTIDGSTFAVNDLGAAALGRSVVVGEVFGSFGTYNSTFDEDPTADQFTIVVGLVDAAAGVEFFSTTIVGPGGIAALSNNGLIDVYSSIVDGSGNGDLSVVNAGGGIVTVRNSLTRDPLPAGVTDGGGNIVSADVGLQPLDGNGGSTPTRLPLTTSPAVDSGDPGYVAFAVDQRDLPREVGVVDMGAVERQADDPADPLVIEPAGPVLPPTGGGSWSLVVVALLALFGGVILSVRSARGA